MKYVLLLLVLVACSNLERNEIDQDITEREAAIVNRTR